MKDQDQEDLSFNENIIELLSILFKSYEPITEVKEYKNPGTYAAISSLFLSISNIFDGLAKDVDIMEGEVLFHEGLNGKIGRSRIKKYRKKKKAISFYKSDLGAEIPKEDLKKFWNREPQEVRERYKKMARDYRKKIYK